MFRTPLPKNYDPYCLEKKIIKDLLTKDSKQVEYSINCLQQIYGMTFCGRIMQCLDDYIKRNQNVIAEAQNYIKKTSSKRYQLLIICETLYIQDRLEQYLNLKSQFESEIKQPSSIHEKNSSLPRLT